MLCMLVERVECTRVLLSQLSVRDLREDFLGFGAGLLTDDTDSDSVRVLGTS